MELTISIPRVCPRGKNLMYLIDRREREYVLKLHCSREGLPECVIPELQGDLMNALVSLD